MAIRTYGVVYGDVTALLPINVKSITATSSLSTTHITSYIEDASGRVTAALKRVGADPDTLDDDTEAQVKRAIKYYAVASSLAKIGRASVPEYTEAKRIYDDALQRFESSSVTLAAQTSGVKTTVDTSPINTSRGVFTRDNMPW